MPDALRQFARQSGTLFKRYAAYRHERQHVCRAHTRMRTVVTAHVYHLAGLLHRPESRIYNCLGTADESYDGAVCGLARVNVKQLYAVRRLYYVCDLLDYRLVASLAEVGHALNNLPCLYHSIKSNYCQPKT